jgi:uncharacterized protein
VLPPDLCETLDGKLASLQAKTGDRLVVVTLLSLRGRTIEEYGVDLGRHWGVGEKGKNNGALLIAAPSERRVRIEVGYGLEGTLTDALSKIVIENAILPSFRAGDIPGGVARGVDDLIVALGGDKTDAEPPAPLPVAAPEPGWRWPTFSEGIGVLAIVALVVLLAEKLWFGFLFAAFLVAKLLMGIGVLPARAQRTGWARAFNFADAPATRRPRRKGKGARGRRSGDSGSSGWTSGSSASDSSGSSDSSPSSSSSSDDGGSFGGGGASSDW